MVRGVIDGGFWFRIWDFGFGMEEEAGGFWGVIATGKSPPLGVKRCRSRRNGARKMKGEGWSWG